MEDLTEQLNCYKAQPPRTELITHRNLQKQSESQIDYILTNCQHCQGRSFRDFNEHSDHYPLLTNILLPIKNDTPSRKRKTELSLRNKLFKENIQRIIQHPEWPRRPFLMVAKALGYTHFRPNKTS